MISALHYRLAMQNLARARVRTIVLVLAIALGSGVIFGTLTVLRGIEASIMAGFDRLGADLLVVPEASMVNLTAALLTVEPTSLTLDLGLADELARLAGVARVAPRTLLRFPAPGESHGGNIDACDDPAQGAISRQAANMDPDAAALKTGYFSKSGSACGRPSLSTQASVVWPSARSTPSRNTS
jgi:hypothetical protein